MPEQEISTILNALQNGEITIKGEFVWGSNYTFLAEVCQDADVIQTVYKPSRGEQPLWDFPPASLARREAAAYLVSEALGWQLVPPTVYRKKAPIGPGSLQLFIEHDSELHYFNLTTTDRQRLRPVVLFDLLINNADDKLRTVIWDFAGESIPEKLSADLSIFCQALAPDTDLYRSLLELLSQKEIKALAKRATHLTDIRKFPQPNPNERSFPWPPL
jgi:hypothetical protein